MDTNALIMETMQKRQSHHWPVCIRLRAVCMALCPWRLYNSCKVATNVINSYQCWDQWTINLINVPNAMDRPKKIMSDRQYIGYTWKNI